MCLSRPQRSRLVNSLDLDGYEHIILYYGSIDAWVDFDLLIRLLQRIQRDCPRTLLLLVGVSHSNAMRLTLQDLIGKYRMQGYVKLIPPQPYEKVPLFVNAADAVIAPYKECSQELCPSLEDLGVTGLCKASHNGEYKRIQAMVWWDADRIL